MYYLCFKLTHWISQREERERGHFSLSLRFKVESKLIQVDIKGIPNVFRAGLRDPCTWNVARLSESAGK